MGVRLDSPSRPAGDVRGCSPMLVELRPWATRQGEGGSATGARELSPSCRSRGWNGQRIANAECLGWRRRVLWGRGLSVAASLEYGRVEAINSGKGAGMSQRSEISQGEEGFGWPVGMFVGLAGARIVESVR